MLGTLNGKRLSHLEKGMIYLRLPPEAWGRRRRCATAVVIAVAVFGVGVHGWQAAGLTHSSASRAALEDAQRRLNDAQQTLARLPALRARELAPSSGAAMPSLLSHWREISVLAEQSGLTLQTLEPIRPIEAIRAIGEGDEMAQPIRITAQTNYAGLLNFFRGMRDLPILIVPHDLKIERDKASDLFISMTLNLFPKLPAIFSPTQLAVLNEEQDEAWFFDPFAPFAQRSTDILQWRLAGLLHTERAGIGALALLAMADEVTMLETGQSVGKERVVHIDEGGVAFASEAGMRWLHLTELWQ